MINSLKGRHFIQKNQKKQSELSLYSAISDTKKQKSHMTSVKINFWRTIALAYVFSQVEQVTAMTMLGPSRRENGLNLVQTNSEALQVVSPGAALAQVAEAPDDDPCHN